MGRERKPLVGCLMFIGELIFLLCLINITVFLIIPTIQQNRWKELQPENYSFTFGDGTFNGISSTVRETVHKSLQEAQPSRGNIPGSTIDDLFDQIRQEVFNPLAIVIYSVKYDPTYGYPTYLWEVDLDLGRITEVKDFTPE